MSFTYDPASPAGQVRLLTGDRDQATALFADAEIQAFLDLNAGDVRLGAAQAIDQIAANEAYIQGRILLDNLQTDGPRLAEQLRAQAAELRRQVYEGDPNDAGFAIAEQVFDPFTAREEFVNQALRQQG